MGNLEEVKMNMGASVPILSLFVEQTKVHLKHGLQKTHVCTLVQANLVLPEDNEKYF